LAGCEFLGARIWFGWFGWLAFGGLVGLGRAGGRGKKDSWQWQRTKEQPSEQAVKKVSTKTATAAATGGLWAPRKTAAALVGVSNERCGRAFFRVGKMGMDGFSDGWMVGWVDGRPSGWVTQH